MKKTLLFLVLAAGCAAANAQQAPTAAMLAVTSAATPAAAPDPASYDELLRQTVEAIMHTGDAAELTARMERASIANTTDWLPRYYQAYALVVSVFTGKASGDAKDKALDQAEAAIAQARQLKGDESELLALQAYLYQARLGIAPMLRSRKYSGLVMEDIALAKSLNPANPRPYLVEANNVYYTPAMFGGGAEKARPLYELAKAKFAAFQPAGPLAPSWGQYLLQARLKSYEVPATAATRGN